MLTSIFRINGILKMFKKSMVLPSLHPSSRRNKGLLPTLARRAHQITKGRLVCVRAHTPALTGRASEVLTHAGGAQESPGFGVRGPLCWGLLLVSV